MALEGILEKLSVEKDGEFKASDKYDSQVLYGSSEGLDELDKTNLESKEGLAKYKTLTGDDPTKYSQRKLTSRKDMRLRGGREDFGAYVDTNFTEMIKKDVDEQVQVQIAYKYCPTKDVSDKDAKPYNEKRKIVSDTKETIKKTVEWAKKLEPDTAQFFPLMVYPGTEAFKWAQENKYLTTEKWEDWLTKEGTHNTIIHTEHLSPKDLVEGCDWARNEFYMRPSYILGRLKLALTRPEEAPRLLKGGRTFLKYLFNVDSWKKNAAEKQEK